jgi:hypothetical protein
MEVRGLGERPSPWAEPHERPSVLFTRTMETPDASPALMLSAVHGLVWLAHVATSAGTCTPADALGDRGWLHEAVHWMAMRSGPEWTVTRDQIAAVERAVPGFTAEAKGAEAFEARWSTPRRERLADFVVGIDVEHGPGLAALRGLVVELAAVADRLETAIPIPAEPNEPAAFEDHKAHGLDAIEAVREKLQG